MNLDIRSAHDGSYFSLRLIDLNTNASNIIQFGQKIASRYTKSHCIDYGCYQLSVSGVTGGSFSAEMGNDKDEANS